MERKRDNTTCGSQSGGRGRGAGEGRELGMVQETSLSRPYLGKRLSRSPHSSVKGSHGDLSHSSPSPSGPRRSALSPELGEEWRRKAAGPQGLPGGSRRPLRPGPCPRPRAPTPRQPPSRPQTRPLTHRSPPRCLSWRSSAFPHDWGDGRKG